MHQLRNEVINRSRGTFLWVILAVRILNKAYDQGKSSIVLLQKLETIPPELHDLFAQIFAKDNEDIDECVTLLRWVLFSLRPLHPSELYQAVQVTHSSDETIPWNLNVTSYLLHCSRGLVESSDGPRSLQRVQLVHETVNEFLKTRPMLGLRQSDTSMAHITETDFQADSCHLKLAETCLHYLLQMCRKSPLNRAVLEHNPLARYAARFWWQHVQASQDSCSQSMLDLALELLNGSSANRLVWVQLFNIGASRPGLDLSFTADRLLSPLHYAVLVGIPELVLSVIALSLDFNARSGFYNDVLQAASQKGNERIVQILLDNIPDVDGQYLRYVLGEASYFGQGRLVHYILKRGADVNGQAGSWGSALHAASRRGELSVTRILLNHGAHVNVQWGQYGDVLQYASSGGFKKVVRILLDRDANVNAQTGRYGNALRAAASYGHENVMRLLLDAGADVNARGGEHNYNALQTASAHKSSLAVEPLLDAGADVNGWREEQDYTALQLASAHQPSSVVQMLLDAGADVNDQGEEHNRTALQLASARGCVDAVRMLLDAGADVNARGGAHGSTALQLAAGSYSTNRESVVQMLLEAGADVNSRQGVDNYTALHAAAESPYLDGKKMVQMLLNAGADVNARGGADDRTVLQVASRRTNMRVIRTLLDAGADVNARGGKHNNTTLQDASTSNWNDRHKVVQMLLDAGADVNARGGEFSSTALQDASCRGHQKVVEILLEYGAESG